jgi:hypothetical protein
VIQTEITFELILSNIAIVLTEAGFDKPICRQKPQFEFLWADHPYFLTALWGASSSA